MAYIDKVKSGKKTHFYLGKTLRIGPATWKKIRIRLGSENPTKEIIAKKLKEMDLAQYRVYNEDYIDASKLEVIDDFKEGYQEHLKRVPATVAEKEETDFLIRFTYNSNAIEGNRLTLRETYLIIEESKIPSGAPPKDYNEAVNGKEAFGYLKLYQGDLSIPFMEQINSILTKNTGVVYPGRLRFFPVRILGADFTPPHDKEVRPLLEKMIDFYSQNKRKVHPFVMACLIHAQFVEIHPFEDGNGRTGRALLNWILMRAGYPKLYVPVKNRDSYYAAIDMHNQKNVKGYGNTMFDLMVGQMKP